MLLQPRQNIVPIFTGFRDGFSLILTFMSKLLQLNTLCFCKMYISMLLVTFRCDSEEMSLSVTPKQKTR